MKVDESKVSIATLRDMLDRGDLQINRDYQRAPGLWPNSARSYFIDTILEGYPFPKVYFHEYLDRRSKKVRTDIVDGQQRITTIQDFLLDKFALGKNSGKYQGLRFSDLDEDTQERFLFYVVPTDVIRDAGRPKILQMFRRMNAFTLPLNAAEKRNSDFSGEFKDLINRLLDRNSFLTEWEIFTPRQAIRLADAALVTDLVLAMEEGVVSSSDSKLYKLYGKYDKEFPESSDKEAIMNRIFDHIALDLSEIRGTYMAKPAAIHSLFCAMYHNLHGLPGFAEDSGLQPIGTAFGVPRERAVSNLLNLAAAHQDGDTSRYPEYVEAMSAGSNRERQRFERVSILCQALRQQI
ncbi:MAG: DUF262 domain-containing protein [Pseudomonadota bacterium]